ncbi:VOC family protein [Cupriavidus sp. MP-37]|uniref:VOC family protein n=1 Tax=Cupriavidus sp. MP-37 TaxID=2884455 RepID=UPI001D0B9F37|nr:VOC family protein [Cupriavidus sp. MP-37]UDM52777.1 VOC family protein [Cupriavidus sp. MP-37]
MESSQAGNRPLPDVQPAAARYAVHSIDYFTLEVPDLAVAEHFLLSFGLTVQRKEDCLDVFAADRHRWARFYEGESKRLAYLSFNCFEADLAGIRQQLAACGATIVDDARFGSHEGVWFFDPDGNLIQIKPGPKTSPSGKSVMRMESTPAGVRGSAMRSQVPQIRPRRLSHVLMFSPDVSRALNFYRDAIGLRLSDRSGDLIAFTHAPHGSDHHLLALVKSSAKGWHHSAWDVDSVNEVGQGASQMAAAGYAAGWGTGRHVLGSNYFFYVRDPWGSFFEYSADIDYIAAGQTWPAGDFPPEDSLYQWGPDVPADFVRNTEA